MTAPEEITTEHLILRRYQPEDAPLIFECYAQDREVTRFLSWAPHQRVEETEEFVRGRIDAWGHGDDFTWVVTTRDGCLIGGIGIRVKGFKANFGYVIGRAFWGNGYATEALSAVISWALAQPEIHRVWGVCDTENVSSSRVMAKAGMTKEGVLRKFIMHPQVSDTPRDCICYSITREG